MEPKIFLSRTLFWYIFKDLLKIFFLASGAVAGIMSFGGLLRPLTEHGLGAAQVAKMLGYFMPAMQTYSLPVAALFATTMVYGRLSADNEITACRAAGISMGPFGIALPAVVLGIVVMVASGIFLYFIVPVFTLKVEKVIYSNIAQLVESQIERNHRIEMNPGNGKSLTIFAQSAEVMPSPTNRPKDQVVELTSPVFVTYEPAEKDHEGKVSKNPAAAEFYMARKALAFITQDEDSGEIYMQAVLTNGMKFPRRYRGGEQQATQISVDETGFYSDPMESPVRENTKFMPWAKLNELLEHPERSRRLKRPLNEFIRDDQRQMYLKSIADSLNSSIGAYAFAGSAESYLLRRGNAPVYFRGDRLIIGGNPDATSTTQPAKIVADASSEDDDVDVTPAAAPVVPPASATISKPGNGRPTSVPTELPKLVQTNANQGVEITSHEIELRVTPTLDNGPDGEPIRRLVVDAEFVDAFVQTGSNSTSRSRFSRTVSVPMPRDVVELENNDLKAYINTPNGRAPDRLLRLRRDEMKLTNSITAEFYARASFSVSCLILVLIGAALGMMFKSGNFLSAFALSVVPAGMCILLIITGQHTCENVPVDIRNFHNPLSFGIAMIWMGNAIVAVLAVALLGRLRSQ